MTVKIIFFDTETNGLPQNKYAPPSEHAAFPALLQISWAIAHYEADGAFTVENERHFDVRLHPSIRWDAAAAKIHGRTEDASRYAGTPATEVLREFAAALREVDIVVAHNLSFDKAIIRAAAYAEADRGGAPVSFRSFWPAHIREYCTMEGTRDLLQIPSPSGYSRWKVPRLNELYTWLYGHPYDISGAVLHNSLSDMNCLVRCFVGLLGKAHVRVLADGRIMTTAVSSSSHAAPSS